MQVLTGVCPDSECRKQLFFPAELNASIECTNCGQRHDKKHLDDVRPVSNPGHALQGLLQSLVAGQIPDHVKKTSDFIKVRGLSNYGCKLISPLLTEYGLHKDSQEVRLLRDMNQGETFDCAHLGDRAFLIEEQNLSIPGYGKDTAADYLQDTLQEIVKVNNGEERLLPVHADGDGHCLLHAISRALVGHELFWHPLSTNLKLHFLNRQEDYQNMFKDFIEVSEWADIIAECDPDFVPSYGETHGLRNIHIFGLANILNRPIILIDNLEGLQSKGDYSAVFLPVLMPFDKCKNKKGELHKPIVISWSSKGRNHFVPLVGIQGKDLPKFPVTLLPKVWGLPQELLVNFIDVENGSCVIGGGNSLQERYLRKLTQAMEKQFLFLKGVSPTVVTDVYHHIFRSCGVVGVPIKLVTETALAMARDELLYKCQYCHAVIEEKLPFSAAVFQPGGELYELAKEKHTTLKDGYKYRFPRHNIVCEYIKSKDKLKYLHNEDSLQCPHCKGPLRMLKPDGTLVYFNGDQLSKRASVNSKCKCGYKHFWDGKEYDNLPMKIPVVFEWNDKKIDEIVYWFQYEADPSLNSNAYEIAQDLVQSYFPGEFGSERLVQEVVETIIQYTTQDCEMQDPPLNNSPTCIPTKIFLTGESSKTLHKEELNASRTEKILQNKIEHAAPVKQKRMSSPMTKESPGKTSPDNANEKDLTPSPTREKVKKANSNRKIRIACEDRGNVMHTLLDTTTYSDLESFIKEQFQIGNNDVDIKYDYPPKLLIPELDADGNHMPLTVLKHGEKVTVHLKKVQKESIANTLEYIDERETVQRDSVGQLASSLFSLFDQVDLWKRSLFQTNGLLYKMAFRDLGILTDDQHVSLPCFPGKIFAYSEKDDEILLCLGSKHIPVKPLTEQETKLANEQGRKKQHEIISNAPKPRQPRATSANKHNNLPSRGYVLHPGGMMSSYQKKREVVDDIPTIRETIDFATFGMETETTPEAGGNVGTADGNGSKGTGVDDDK